MPAGDAQRTWFPEMLEMLRSRWHVGLSCAELIELRNELDAMFHRIRSERHVRPPVFKCPHCGRVGEGAEPDISVRATILSLGRFGITSAKKTKALETEWARYRKQNGLDLHGKPVAAPARAPACSHQPATYEQRIQGGQD